MLLKLSSIFFSCNIEEATNVYKIDELELIFPQDWKLLQVKGVDSEVFNLITEKSDTIFIDYGIYSDKFAETPILITREFKKTLDSIGEATGKEAIVTDNYDEDFSQGLYLKEYFFYEVIDGYKAKIGLPKKEGDGRVLINIRNIDSLGNSLSMFCSNVSKKTEQDVLRMFRSIRFKRK